MGYALARAEQREAEQGIVRDPATGEAASSSYSDFEAPNAGLVFDGNYQGLVLRGLTGDVVVAFGAFGTNEGAITLPAVQTTDTAPHDDTSRKRITIRTCIS